MTRISGWKPSMESSQKIESENFRRTKITKNSKGKTSSSSPSNAGTYQFGSSNSFSVTPELMPTFITTTETTMPDQYKIPTKVSNLEINNSSYEEESPTHRNETIGNFSESPVRVDQHKVEDIVLASITILMIMTNLLGNISAFAYFIRKRKRSPDLFYTVISAVDISISLFAIPVIVSLMSYRKAVLFTDSIFCETWFVLFSTLMKVSMFLVMILNIFRTIAVVFPFYDIHSHDKKIIPGTLIYVTILSAVDAIYLCTKKVKVMYRKPLCFCQVQPILKGSGVTYANIYSGLYQLEVLIPSLVTFICFVMTTVSLAKSSSSNASMNRSENDKRFRKITVTIAMFTAVFLVCNLPQFVEQIMYLATGFNGKIFKEKIFKNSKMWQKYGHFTTMFMLAQLNSALNPCLYIARMPQFRAWLRHWDHIMTNLSHSQNLTIESTTR